MHFLFFLKLYTVFCPSRGTKNTLERWSFIKGLSNGGGMATSIHKPYTMTMAHLRIGWNLWAQYIGWTSVCQLFWGKRQGYLGFWPIAVTYSNTIHMINSWTIMVCHNFIFILYVYPFGYTHWYQWDNGHVPHYFMIQEMGRYHRLDNIYPTINDNFTEHSFE